ncbi:17800_t:CDS:2, partial [Racocetra persica]
ERVMLNATNLMLPENIQKLSRKLTPRFIGPFEIVERLYYPNEFEDRNTSLPPSILVEVNPELEYKVECILNK